MKTKLLSICIPTFNRCEILDQSLHALFSSTEFDESQIEVIVSDNFSTDLTKEVVAKYPLVKYYCNDKNIGFLNLITSLNYATGSYIKLFNDTLSFKPNCLATILERIEKHLDQTENVFFYANMFKNSDCNVSVNSIEDFFKEVSFYSTWTANFGMWLSDFHSYKSIESQLSLLFPHLNVLYNVVDNGKPTGIYFDDLFNVATPSMKGGHNVFDTIVNEYLSLAKKQKISLLTYEMEKYNVCRYLIYPTLVSLLITDKHKFSYDTSGVFSIILKKYWYEPYLYLMLILFFLKRKINL